MNSLVHGRLKDQMDMNFEGINWLESNSSIWEQEDWNNVICTQIGFGIFDVIAGHYEHQSLHWKVHMSPLDNNYALEL